MKIILRQDVESLGHIGEIATVKAGYARNYLIPNQLAYVATPGAIRSLETEKKQYEGRMAKARTHAEGIAAQLAELQITVPMQVGEEGRIFGSVTGPMIAQELELRGFTVDKRNIIIDEPIKTLGIFDVKVKLHTDVIAPLKVWVIGQE
ncbi:MAG: 50S ribosomal protein L9 [Ignavibacteria bacterium]|nr:50S ribosomal protein L9 [Ignavibacteria bacterium]MBP7092783.1 50S ribosomal protein L9 [Candidatus Kapabacteria bacterium]MBK6419046.1 50S ribosomal protein L9 [Ignavibacteria bacterium]MBK6760268.1 50S ribosomal protein L9 [Ignavibacteria bacterium]MBK7033990.1 50S ribosomal protein L9 [Ignavibacteria bacterium]